MNERLRSIVADTLGIDVIAQGLPARRVFVRRA
jgi:hypothetical protein